MGHFGPKFQAEGATPTNHSSCKKTRCIDLSYGVRMRAEVCFIFFTFHAFDRRMDGQTDAHGKTAAA